VGGLLRNWALGQVGLDLGHLADDLGQGRQSRVGLLEGGLLLSGRVLKEPVNEGGNGKVAIGVSAASDMLAIVVLDLLLQIAEHAGHDVGLDLLQQLLLALSVRLAQGRIEGLQNVAQAFVSLVGLNGGGWGGASQTGETSNGADNGGALDHVDGLVGLWVNVLQNWELLSWVVLLDLSPLGGNAGVLEGSLGMGQHPADQLSTAGGVEVNQLELHVGQIAAAASRGRAGRRAGLGSAASGARGSSAAGGGLLFGGLAAASGRHLGLSESLKKEKNQK